MRETVLILANSGGGLLSFRRELLEELISRKIDVVVSVPKDKNTEEIQRIGCTVINAPINRRGTDIFQEIKLIVHYRNIMRSVNPEAVLTYTIKPNIYGGLVARFLNISYMPNVTGLGTALNNDSFLKQILIKLYKYSFSKASMIFFQNETNKVFFEENNILGTKNQIKLLPGSGVNIEEYTVLPYPDTEEVHFVFISRIMKDKGIDHYLEAAEYITKKYSNIHFHICGSYEEDYQDEIEKLHNKGTIIYHGSVPDVREVLKDMHCIIHPSYHEGMSNVLLEAAASGRPIIASDIPGCRETFDEGISGFSFSSKNTEELITVTEEFIHLTNEERKKMGLAGRKKMEEDFDRKIVVNAYMEEINKIMEGKTK